MVISKSIIDTIKTAILEAQYKAAKAVNAVQLSLYFSIGKYVSEHTRKGYWGTGALEYISEQLQRELPGLRGFSATNLKRMRVFYEEWASDSLSDNYNSTVMTVELQSGDSNSSLTSDELEKNGISHYYPPLELRIKNLELKTKK
ncbi:MAG: DUF1016 N-terminal domain-containing protein [Capnocytophaga granulosa]